MERMAWRSIPVGASVFSAAPASGGSGPAHYLVGVIDWYSRYVVAWELSESSELPFVLTAAKRALSLAVPTLGNHDQGNHFTSLTYTALLLDKGVQISMDHRGRAFDNIFSERLWRSVKY